MDLPISEIFKLRNLNEFPEFYNFFSSKRKFFILPYKKQLCKVDSKNISVTSIFSENQEINIPFEIQKNISKLPEDIYLAFLEKGIIDFANLKNSVYSLDPTFQADLYLYLFDLLDENLTYEARYEKLNLLVSNKILQQIELYSSDLIFFNPNEDRLKFWNRLLMYTTKGDIILRHWDHMQFLDIDIPIYKDYKIKKCKVVKRKQNNKYRYLICKYNDKYFPVISGLDKSDFINININDLVYVVFLEYQDEILYPIFVRKSF